MNFERKIFILKLKIFCYIKQTKRNICNFRFEFKFRNKFGEKTGNPVSIRLQDTHCYFFYSDAVGFLAISVWITIHKNNNIHIEISLQISS